MSLEIEEVTKVLGPKGGNVSSPVTRPEARNAHLNAAVLPNGDIGLHRQKGFTNTTAIGRVNEKPWHRMAAYMLLAGRTNSEIALAADVEPSTVSGIRAQRWFQELLATLANNEGDEIVGQIKAEAAASLNTMIDIRDDDEINPRTRLSAATTILELGHGKAVQRNITVSASTTFQSPQDEMSDINRELEALRSSRECPPSKP